MSNEPVADPFAGVEPVEGPADPEDTTTAEEAPADTAESVQSDAEAPAEEEEAGGLQGFDPDAEGQTPVEETGEEATAEPEEDPVPWEEPVLTEEQEHLGTGVEGEAIEAPADGSPVTLEDDPEGEGGLPPLEAKSIPKPEPEPEPEAPPEHEPEPLPEPVAEPDPIADALKAEGAGTPEPPAVVKQTKAKEDEFVVPASDGGSANNRNYIIFEQAEADVGGARRIVWTRIGQAIGRNGDVALRRAYRGLADARGEFPETTLVCVAERMWRPKPVAARERHGVAIDVG